MSDGPGIVVTPPPYKNRRGWLIAFGTVEILIGCILLGMIGLSIFALRMASSAPAVPPAAFPGAPSPAVVMAMVAAFYGVLAVVFVTVGIGSIQARRWARIAMLVISWCWLAMGVLGVAMMAVMMPMIMESARQQSKTPMPPGFDSAFRVGMLVVLGAFFVVLPLIFVLFYSGKNVKATVDAASNQGATGSRKPVSVVIVAGLFALSAVSCIGFVAMPMGFPLLGTVLTGAASRAFALVMVGLCAWLAWNLYQQRTLAWWVAMGWIVFSWVSGLMTQSRLGLIEMYHRMGYTEIQIGQMMPFLTYGLVVGWVVGLAFFVFLLAIRKQFTEPTAPAA